MPIRLYSANLIFNFISSADLACILDSTAINSANLTIVIHIYSINNAGLDYILDSIVISLAAQYSNINLSWPK